MNAVDTNVLIYCYDRRDPRKQQLAQSLLAGLESFVLLWQVGSEFIAASRKLAADGFTEDDAWQALTRLQKLAVRELMPVPAVWEQCARLRQSHALQFWDALIVAACLEGGISTLHSEDLAGHGRIDGLSIVDPFAVSP